VSAADIVQRSRARARRQSAAGAIVALLVIFGAVLALRPATHPSSTPAAPPGVTPKVLARPDLGFSVQIPSDWIDATRLHPYPVFYRGTGGPPVGWVFAGPIPSTAHTLEEAADLFTTNPRVVTLRYRKHVIVDGSDAIRIRFTIPAVVETGATQVVDDTTVITRNRAGQLIMVTAGARDPRPDDALVEWVASTIKRT
jgi:hypothetical protein